MIGLGGDAPMALAVLWALTGLALFFVLLRLYTRLVVIQAYGVDDHFFNFAFLLFVAYDVMLTISSFYGFGRNILELEMDNIPKAILYEAIGSTILVSAIVVSKASLALFLLRLVNTRLHQILVLAPVIILFLFALVSLLVFWFSCTPINFLWDRLIPGGSCPIDPGPISTAAGAWSVVVDFWYAITPWALLWNVQIPKREKLLINVSMSLGVIAGACGILRALELKNLNSVNFTKDTVGLIIWHAAELAVTLVCIGIPVCRPLFKGWLSKWTSRNGSKPGPYTDTTGSNMWFGLKTIGGTDYTARVGLKAPDLDLGTARSGDEPKGSTTRSAGKGFGDNESAESILGPDIRYNQARDTDIERYSSDEGKGGKQNIHVWPEVAQILHDHFLMPTAWKVKNPSQDWTYVSDNPLFKESQYGLGNKIDFLAALTLRDPVGISSANVHDRPVIDPTYLSTAVDRYAVREAFKFDTKLLRSDLKLVGRDVLDGELTADTPLTVASPHEAFAVRAGQVDGRVEISPEVLAIVSSSLTGLFVADSFVFLVSISANLQVSMYAMTLQAADIIEEHGSKCCQVRTIS
ncbi:hypothetical protein CORC01_05957 [Colletotrichum orchidophilum]|uniref:Rhodopsin domain-containing protein n=1 Tax=Colletotrichum orchidophilum TaxID=1209926 RepID=A0A1G4BBB0_9PEZI|nr:uncharacterized protein CORC01_05957 [Colletotrichum orchidophilum]OHE98691.1 hypothetical protein CORC01_05957 [Colletotrichum orchidophilum]